MRVATNALYPNSVSSMINLVNIVNSINREGGNLTFISIQLPAHNSESFPYVMLESRGLL